MGTAAETLAEFAVAFNYKDLPQDAVQRAKLLVLDTVGCALGAYGSEPCSLVSGLVDDLGGVAESTIIGSGKKTSCPNAALANGAMIRYLDFNDTYWSPSIAAAHPSNTLAEALAVAERQHLGGKDLIAAMALGYELQVRLLDVFRMDHFSSQGTLGSIAAPVIAGKLLGLSAGQIANAIGISASHNLVNVGVYGEGASSSMMKCVQQAFASHSGIMAALLAQKGFTGPKTIIETHSRVYEAGRSLARLARPRDTQAILLSWMKYYTAYHMGHTAIAAALALREEHGITPDKVQSIDVRVFERGLERALPRPASKEEADHSIPYLIAIALTEGAVGPDQYARQQWKDPKVLKLVDKVHMRGDSEWEKVFPGLWPCVVEITTTDGKRHSRRVDVPKGATEVPMTEQEVQEKFRGMASKRMTAAEVDRVISMTGRLENVRDVGELMKALVASK